MDRTQPHKLEFALLVAVIGAIALALFGALARTREQAEEAAVNAESTAIRVELLDRLAHRELYGGELPASRNPLDWVARRPPGYLGERDTPPAGGGSWYFDRRRQQLVYQFHSGRFARFRLAQGRMLANAPGGLSGVGLERISENE